MPEPIVAAPAPSAPLAPVAPPAAPNTLAEFRAQRAASRAEPAPAPLEPAQVVSAPTIHTAVEPPEPPEEGEPAPPAQAEPKPDPSEYRWKDPDTGVGLDLRRRDHRKIKRALEERSDLARRVSQPAYQPEPRQDPPPPQARPAAQPDPRDPEPQLEQFADQSDPYGAYTTAAARWHARQEFQQQHAAAQRVERGRQVRDAIDRAQQAFDAKLPEARTRHADFDAAHAELLAEVGRLPMPARTPLVHRLLTSPLGHDLTHYLGSHPEDLAAVVSARSAYEQGLVLGAIETRVRALVTRATTPAPPLTPAPAPIAPVGGSASSHTLPDGKTMSLAQFRANKARLGMRA